MPELTRRLQVLIDAERHARLREAAERTGAPVGELVRRAIDREYPPEATTRAEAARRLLEAQPPRGREPDWEVSKSEMLDGRHRS